MTCAELYKDLAARNPARARLILQTAGAKYLALFEQDYRWPSLERAIAALDNAPQTKGRPGDQADIWDKIIRNASALCRESDWDAATVRKNL